MLRWPLLLSLASGIVGCAAAADPSVLPQTILDPMAPIDVQALARDVARIRHVSLAHPVAVRTVPGWIMSQRFQQRDRLAFGGASGDGASLATFGFAPPGTSITGTTQSLLAHGVTGYYDSRDKVLFIRDAMGDRTRVVPQGPRDRDVLAHEIAHALQDERFGLNRAGDAEASVEATLAYRALVEGDARLTELGVHADSLHQLPHWVSRAAWALTRVQKGDAPRAKGADAESLQPELGRAPLYVRRVLDFPYVEGALFVAALRRAGGPPLVDVAFAHPPQTTEQVLHPGKYVMGEGAVPVAMPMAPDGWHVVEKGTLGELRTSILLAQCLSREEAGLAATGWGGDAWSVLADPGDHRAIVWSTVWDDEDSAARFESAARGRGLCLQAATLDPRVGREVTVLRDGTRVAYAQGLPDAVREPIARSLLGLVGEPPAPKPPAGAVTIPPLVFPDAEFLHKGAYEQRTWRSGPLGMHVDLPDGFEPTDAGGAEAAMIDKDGWAYVTFGVVFAPPGDELEQRIVHDLLAKARRMVSRHGDILDYRGASTTMLHGRKVREFKWGVALGLQVRVLLIPACSGQATVPLVMMWISNQGSFALDRWLASFHLPSEDSTACEELQGSANDE